MTKDVGKRLLLGVLLKGLADAVRRNDLAAVERYCVRLRSSTDEPADDGPLENAVEKLLTASALWTGSAEADRNEAKQQMLEVIDRGIRLLT